MGRTDTGEPYYNILSKRGRSDLRWALNHGWLDWSLVREVFSHTWFEVKFRIKRFIGRG